MIFTMIIGGTLTAYASNTMDDAKKKKKEAQEKLDKVNKEIEKKERPVTIRGKKYLDMTDWFNG